MELFIHAMTKIPVQSKRGEEAIRVEGGVTIAFIVGPESIKYAAAFCSPRDQYCRKVGRAIAQERLKNPAAERFVMEFPMSSADAPVRKIAHTIMQDFNKRIAERSVCGMPQWARSRWIIAQPTGPALETKEQAELVLA